MLLSRKIAKMKKYYSNEHSNADLKNYYEKGYP